MTRKMTKRTQCTWHGPVNHLYPGHALCIVIYGTCVASWRYIDKSALHWYGVHYFWPIGRHRNRRCGACRWSAIDSHEIISQAWRYGSLSSRRSTKFQGACFLCIGSSCPERNILAKWCLGHLNSLSQIWHYHFFITYFIPGYQT